MLQVMGSSSGSSTLAMLVSMNMSALKTLEVMNYNELGAQHHAPLTLLWCSLLLHQQGSPCTCLAHCELE